ncbi:hypothetical protein [Ewingella americana]|uniref:Uncharacterized protein n=1 Tax=Ewingella americana TaxID=41202 RepID=A0A502GCG2_9GAMM|nr:hypothetical protein [Ewingella americana]TPG59957.1 hypothetical protein EAH77_15430 [Ewingella americana]
MADIIPILFSIDLVSGSSVRLVAAKSSVKKVASSKKISYPVDPPVIAASSIVPVLLTGTMSYQTSKSVKIADKKITSASLGASVTDYSSTIFNQINFNTGVLLSAEFNINSVKISDKATKRTTLPNNGAETSASTLFKSSDIISAAIVIAVDDNIKLTKVAYQKIRSANLPTDEESKPLATIFQSGLIADVPIKVDNSLTVTSKIVETRKVKQANLPVNDAQMGISTLFSLAGFFAGKVVATAEIINQQKAFDYQETVQTPIRVDSVTNYGRVFEISSFKTAVLVESDAQINQKEVFKYLSTKQAHLPVNVTQYGNIFSISAPFVDSEKTGVRWRSTIASVSGFIADTMDALHSGRTVFEAEVLSGVIANPDYAKAETQLFRVGEYKSKGSIIGMDADTILAGRMHDFTLMELNVGFISAPRLPVVVFGFKPPSNTLRQTWY